MTTEKIDTIQKALDYAIRDAEKKNKQSGYKIGERIYHNYMHNDMWDKYLQGIPDDIKNRIKKELAGKPPHMASFGSSCRMTYNRLKKVKNIVFEYGLPTEVGGEAQLDAYIQAKKIEIFIEAKCREIYKEHYGEKAYKEVYEFLHEWNPKFEFKEENMTFYYNDEAITYFDLKQLICHFLGIAAGRLKGAIKSKKIRFVYLIFNPHHIKDRICDKYRKKILDQYDKTIEEINLFDMEKLFEAIFEYQRRQNKNISHNYEGDIPEFEFFVADQDNVARYLE